MPKRLYLIIYGINFKFYVTIQVKAPFTDWNQATAVRSGGHPMHAARESPGWKPRRAVSDGPSAGDIQSFEADQTNGTWGKGQFPYMSIHMSASLPQ